MSKKIEFGVSTWLWTSPFDNTTISLFPKIKRMGYDFVEIPVEDPSLIDGHLVKSALKENGLKAVVCGVFGPTKDLTSDNVELHRNCFDYIRQCFELCNVWDSNFLAGPMYSSVGKARMVPSEQRRIEWERAVTNIGKVSKMAEEQDLFIALEPLNRFESDLINTADDVMRLIKDVNHSSTKVLLDGFHMAIEEPNIEKAILTVGDKLIHVQVSENYRGTPGTGQTQWNDFKSGLEKIGYKGVISIESFTPDIKELAGAVCIWKHLAPSQDAFASDGLSFLKKTFNS